ncbi:MAG TPA: DUF4159 domain-containing protein, partial [Vicinamibacterales bacterium]|nr:DUF4159 domain-containing protein [Vicinamibacterales bacterium]
MTRRWIVPALAGTAFSVWAIAAIVPSLADAQAPEQVDARYAGLQWTFARIRYDAWTMPSSRFLSAEDEPWFIDAPAAEQNLSRRLKTVTSIKVNDPVMLRLEDPNLWQYPWIYIVEPGNLRLRDAEVPILREFLLRGGTLTFDDFHGPIEWANLEREMKRVFPDRKIIDLPPEHPIFHCFYQIDQYPQTPGLGSFLQGRTWEKGGYVATLRGIEDDAGRAMVLINWNTDMGDGWEWSNAADYPGYVKFTAQAYRMQINEIIYS